MKRTRAARERIKIMRETLARLFPEVIMAKHGNPKRPLKLGIYWDIVAYVNAGYQLDLKEVRSTLAVYCSRPSYLEAMVEGAVRIDLHGRPAGVVTAGQAAFAAKQLVALAFNRERKRAEAA